MPSQQAGKTKKRHDFARSVALLFDCDTVVEGDATRSASIDLALRAIDLILLFNVIQKPLPFDMNRRLT